MMTNYSETCAIPSGSKNHEGITVGADPHNECVSPCPRHTDKIQLAVMPDDDREIPDAVDSAR